MVGFHGTSRAAVPHLLAGTIEQSDRHFEWLGTGFYLWQDSPWRAQQWASITSVTTKLDKGDLIPNAELAGTVPLWEWIGDEGAMTFSY